MHSHIFSHLSQNNILCNKQPGFPHGQSCETQLIFTINNLAKSLNNNGQTDAIF